MLQAGIDHLVVTVPSLEDCLDLASQLGIRFEEGGEHPQMGTHNRLAKLGPGRYLEVLAVNPGAPAPNRPRWFGLDRDPQAARLAGWVARVNDMGTAISRIGASLGCAEPMRRGLLRWSLSIPPDGNPPFHGIGPMLIQWDTDPHPSERLQDQGCSLVRLEGCHPQADAISGLLGSIGFQDEFVVSQPREEMPPRLVAHLQTPNGMCQLSSMGVTRG